MVEELGTHQAIAGAECGQPSRQRPAPHLPDHMARVVGVRLDLGAGDAPVPPLADEARRQEVVVEAQVEFQGLSFVIQFIEGEKLTPGGSGPAVEHSVGQVVGQERSALVNLDGMNDVAAGGRRSRLWGDRGSAVSFGVPQPPSPTPSAGG